MHQRHTCECVACIPYLHFEGLAVKCNWRCIVVFCNNYSSWTISRPKWTIFLLVLCYLDVWCKHKPPLAVVLCVQASISSRWSTRGTALCGLFSILKRTSLWFLPSLTAARGNMTTQYKHSIACFSIEINLNMKPVHLENINNNVKNLKCAFQMTS